MDNAPGRSLPGIFISHHSHGRMQDFRPLAACAVQLCQPAAATSGAAQPGAAITTGQAGRAAAADLCSCSVTFPLPARDLVSPHIVLLAWGEPRHAPPNRTATAALPMRAWAAAMGLGSEGGKGCKCGTK